MALDWLSFTPVTALAGGVLIGIAAAIFIMLNGRIAGVSGIVGGLLRPVRRDIAWRVAFVAGMILAPSVYVLFAALPPIKIESNNIILIIAGLLVGTGTRYGSGCTSGHGVCGISRLSVRSIAATGIFMGAAFITVFLLRHGFSF